MKTISKTVHQPFVRGISEEEEVREDVVRRCLSKAFYYAYRLSGSSEQAERLAMDVLEMADTPLGKQKFASEEMFWVFRLVTNRYLREQKQKKQRAEVTKRSFQRTSKVFLTSFLSQKSTVLPESNVAESLISSLSDSQRAMMILRHVEGFTEEEVACILDLPLSTLQRRLQNLYQLIQKQWYKLSQSRLDEK
jgi:RNA polymerase sigma-70 factor (ECF subfamily)